MPVGEVHAVGVLHSDDRFRDILNFKICFQQFDVQHLAFGGVPAIGTHQIERQIAVVRFDESLHQRRIHARIVHFGLALGYRCKYLTLTIHVHAGPVFRVHPDQQSQAGNFQRPHRQCRD
jgi:hypothetical protein